MIKSDSVMYRASCDGCLKISHILSLSTNKAKGDVLNLPHSQVGHPWIEIDGKLYCDDCGMRLLGKDGYYAATIKYLTESNSAAILR